MSAKAVDHSSASLLLGQRQNGELMLHCPGEVWISIRSKDLSTDALPNALERLVGAVVSPADIKKLLPDWAELRWAPFPPSDLSNGEWVAYSNGYRVNAYGDPGAPIFHDGVMSRLLAFMGVEG